MGGILRGFRIGSKIDDERLDLLVDGELDEAERRRLLVDLERQPDSWRRCALAFIEAQTWRGDFHAISHRADVVPDEVTRPVAGRGRRRVRILLAMAGSFLLALGLGLAWDNFWNSQTGTGWSAQVAEVTPPEERTIVAPSAVTPSPEPVAEPVIPYRFVDLPTTDPESGRPDSIRMPVVGPSRGREWLDQAPSALPEHVVRLLQQRGHEVSQQRRFVPYEATDGSRIVFPVDEVELIPVGNRGYQ